MATSPRGPRPEVLARLAEGVPVAQQERAGSPRARLLGVALCGLTAAAVVLAVVVVGAP